MSLCESPLLIICVLQLPQRLIRVSSVCTQSTLIYVFSSSTLVMLSSHSSKIIWRKSPLSTVNSVKIYEAQITWKSLSNQTAFCSSLSQICVKKKAKSVWGNLKFLFTLILIEFHSAMASVTAPLVKVYCANLFCQRVMFSSL